MKWTRSDSLHQNVVLNRSFSESWYYTKVGKNNIRRKCMAVIFTERKCRFLSLLPFFCRGNKEQTFTKIGYRDWKKANEKFAKHEKSHCHIDATVDFHNFCFDIPVNEQLSNEAAKTETARKEKVRKNREVMKRLIDITLCLAQQGMAFRGHREVDEPSFFAEEEVLDETCTGNFRSVVNLLAKYDAPLSNHIRAVRNSKLKRKRNPIGKTKGKNSRSGRGNLVSFMSADSQDKIINSIGKQLQKFIVGEINATGIYSIAMDCTTGSSHADQLSIIIRYLNRSLDIVERLVRVQRVKESSAEELFNTLQEILKESSLTLKDAVGQFYDGASVMTGKYKGVKTLVQQVNPQCIFIWTFDHVLNLVIMEACGSSLAVKSLFGALEKLYAFFRNPGSVVTFLKRSKRNPIFNKFTDHKEYLCTKLRGEFSKVLARAKTFCVDHELEQDFVSKRTKKKKRLPGELSNDEIEEDPISRYRRETFVYAIDTAIMPIRDRFSSHKAILADFALLDPERFQDINSSNSLPPDAFENVARNYGFDERKLKVEHIPSIEIYPKLWKPKDDRPFNKTSPGPSDDINWENFIAVLKVLSTFNLQSAFPELYTVYKILVTLPIGSTKCERTFSKLKFVKNNLISTMGQKRLNS